MMDDTTDTGGGGVGESEGVDRCCYVSEEGASCGLPWDHEGLHSFEIDGIEKAKAHLSKWVHRSPFIDALIVTYDARIKGLEIANKGAWDQYAVSQKENASLREQVEKGRRTEVKMGVKVKNVPKEIWLLMGDADAMEKEEDFHTIASDWDICWSSNPVDDFDIHYVLAREDGAAQTPHEAAMADTAIEEVIASRISELKAEVERLRGCISSWAECMDICEYKALAKEMRDALTGDKEE